MKKFLLFSLAAILLSGCGIKNSSPVIDNVPPDNASAGISWTLYKNSNLGFSINVPKIIINPDDESNKPVKLNIFEDNGNVYFTSHSLAETKLNKSWEFKISGATVKNEKELLAFVENTYDVKGCKIELAENSDDTYDTNVYILAENESLPLDDPNACFIGGKIRTQYDQKSGKVITYQLVQAFFKEPNGYADEEALASLKFEP